MTELATLIAQWRKNRAPELADEIDRVSAEITAKEKPLKDKKAWWAALETNRPELLERLLEMAPSGLDRADRIAAICKLPADPRMGAFARRWLDEPPVVAKSRAPFFAAVVKLLDHAKDVRVLGVLTPLLAHRSEAMRKCGLINYKPLVAHAESLAKVKPKSVTIKTAPKKKGADAAALFLQVYANPADDAPRAVLADLLVEQNDPRGEFINLQLAGQGANRQKKLQATWAQTWLGTIASVVLKDGVVFERGFPSHVRYAGGAKAAALTAPEWSTITHLDVAQARGEGRVLILAGALASVRHVTGLGEIDLEAVLAKQKEVPWETLGFYLGAWDFLDRSVRLNKKAFGRVKKLVTASADSAPWEVDVPTITKLLAAFPALEEIDLEVDSNFPRLVREAKQLRRIKLTMKMPGLSASFDRATNTLAIDLRYLSGEPKEIAALIRELAPAKVVLSTALKKATIEGNYIYAPKYPDFSLKSIRTAAQKAKSELTFDGIPLAAK